MLDGEPLSPELVLVSPDLAERARALLPDRPDFLERLPLPSPDLQEEALDLQQDEHGAPWQRLDELTTLVDRIAADWQQVERRLAQLERAVARMEAALAVASTPPAPWLEAAPDEDESRQSAVDPRGEDTRTRTGLVGTLVVVAAVIAAIVAVELLPSFHERPRLAVVSEGAVPTANDPAEPSDDPGATTPDDEAPPAITTTVTDTSSSTTDDRPDEPGPAPAPAPETGTRTTTRTAPSVPPTNPPATTSASSFEPARVFVWPAAAGAAGYDVTFLRNGRPFYSARVAKPRLALPDRIQFRPGSYRWIVRPRAAGQAPGSPIVDSTFTIEQS